MSNIAIQGAATGTGVFTLASPATNTDRTLVLPDEAGTVLTTAGVPASAMPAGSVVQVVQTTLTPGGGLSISSGAGSTTVMSLAITPSSTSSKVLVCVSCHLEINNATVGSLSFGERILRGATEIYASGEKWFFNANQQQFEAWHVQYLDSPSTTSSTTYNFQITPAPNRGDIRFGRNGTTIMQLLEIKG